MGRVGRVGQLSGPAANPATTRANDEQRVASDPAVSAFVTASAGSGKTKLLTDRLLRLMLAGTPPGRIQCLTFTKAAAAEMAVRLQRRLGSWVTLDDPGLSAELRALVVEPTQEALDRARALFADVLDVPGSMRIGTIHAFCQSLLRRFPLEAKLSPRFQLIDETEARQERDRAREAELTRADPGALARLAGLLSADQFGAKIAALVGQAPRLGDRLSLPDRRRTLRRALGASFETAAELIADAVLFEEAELRRAVHAMHRHGSPSIVKKAERMLGWLGLTPDLRAEHWTEWRSEFFTKSNEVRGHGTFANDKLAARDASVIAAMLAEAERVACVDGELGAIRLAAATDDLLSLATPILAAYAGRKRDAGLLDYPDLIERTGRLLENPGAAWVLFKLDGGIDHLLLDEVQDTAPDQWRIAHTLSEEFFAGSGARAVRRTFFAVGDPKQSIFSFQGAEPSEFERARDRVRGRVRDAGQSWRDVTLDVSFRSTTPVLDLVDAVFADPAATPGVDQPGGLHHVAARAGQAGRVELWPLAPSAKRDERAPWSVPDRNETEVSGLQRLATTLAARLAAEIGSGEVAAGDVLVLVQRRGTFARTLVRSLKTAGVAVAGLDRLDLAAQAAVQDLLALCDTLLLPGDDLSLACVLTSPLGGLDDHDLIELTAARTASLWEVLRARAAERPAWQSAWSMLSGLLGRADHVTPHALLASALGEWGGRARLLARLGPEAAEPIDELLRLALEHTRAHPPSLQGFAHWMRRAGAEVKREAEGSGDAVRVMTAHGAKGLQARLVVLADTTGMPPTDDAFTWVPDPATGAQWPVWRPSAEWDCPALAAAREIRDRDRTAEHNRLLYVALTRAEDRLIVCGWAPRAAPAARCWYRLVEAGFARLTTDRRPFGPEWEGEIEVLTAPQSAAPDRRAASARDRPDTAMPAWAGVAPNWRPRPPPAERLLPRPLAPSRPEGVRLGPVPAAASPIHAADLAARRRRGEVVHELLQHVPLLPPAGRVSAARARAAMLGHAGAADDAIGVMNAPELHELFGPGSRAEQPLTGLVDGVVVSGVVDRLVVLPDRVVLADYKTGRTPPGDVARTPVLYLRQLAAYRAVVRGAFPGRDVRCILVWTDSPVIVHVPDALLDRHAPGLMLREADAT